MKLNTLYSIMAVIALGYGLVAVLLPSFLVQLLWLNPAGPEGYLLLQGWGSCLIAFSVIAWGARRLESIDARRVISLGFLTYFAVASILWLVDALSRGWTIFSALTLALLVIFALGFGYFALDNSKSARSMTQMCLAALALFGLSAAVLVGVSPSPAMENQRSTFVETVRQANERYKNVSEAEAAGYKLFHGCVSGPQEGAMGIHFTNSALVSDGALDPAQPEALLYEYKNGLMQLAGVEYVVIAENWHARNEAPPVLMGHLMNYVSSPNRYGIPAFYELHVWAWSPNPMGTFADWNPNASCDGYVSESVSHQPDHQSVRAPKGR